MLPSSQNPWQSATPMTKHIRGVLDLPPPPCNLILPTGSAHPAVVMNLPPAALAPWSGLHNPSQAYTMD